MYLKKIFRNLLKQSELGKDIWYILHSCNVFVSRFYSDETYFKRVYKKATGKELDFKNPRTFDERQLWLKMYYRDSKCTECSDKYLVRQYVKECGLEHILNPVHAVYNCVEEIEWDKLPNCFYMKANHMSACNIRCNDLSTFDKRKAEKILRRGLKHNYYYDSREWNYRDIQRKIIVEDIIEGTKKESLVDYRFLCYSGKCEYIFVDIDTADEKGSHRTDAKRNVYDRDMNLLDVMVSRQKFDPNLVEKPQNFDEMLKYAEILSKPFPFCRVDLYNVEGRIIFGEITFFHAGGISHIEPKEWEYKLGEHIPVEELKMKYQQ